MRAKPTLRNSSWLYINYQFVCSPTRSEDCFLCPPLGRAASGEMFSQNSRSWLINNNHVISQHGCDVSYLRTSIPFIRRSFTCVSTTLSFSAWLFVDILCWVYAWLSLGVNRGYYL